MFEELYSSALHTLRPTSTANQTPAWYLEVDMNSGRNVRSQFSALQCFWPGMQAGLGDMPSASHSLNAFYHVWNQCGFTPEDFDVNAWKHMRGGGHNAYLLRPELVESTMFLHQATQDDSWLFAGEHVLKNVEKHARTECGYASIGNVETKTLMDNMPSFFLSELCK